MSRFRSQERLCSLWSRQTGFVSRAVGIDCRYGSPSRGRTGAGGGACSEGLLAGQLLILQLVIVLVVLVAVAASVAQAQASFREVQGRQVIAAAEGRRPTPPSSTCSTRPSGCRWRPSSTATATRRTRGYVAGTDRRILTATDPTQVGRLLDLHGSDVLRGRGWEAVVTEGGIGSVVAHAPVMATGRPRLARREGDRRRRGRRQHPGLLAEPGGRRAQPAHLPGRGQPPRRGRLAAAGPAGEAADARPGAEGRSPGWPSTGTRCSTGSRKASSASTPSTA